MKKILLLKYNHFFNINQTNNTKINPIYQLHKGITPKRPPTYLTLHPDLPTPITVPIKENSFYQTADKE